MREGGAEPQQGTATFPPHPPAREIPKPAEAGGASHSPQQRWRYWSFPTKGKPKGKGRGKGKQKGKNKGLPPWKGFKGKSKGKGNKQK